MSSIGRALRFAALLLLVLLPQVAAAEGLRFGQGLLWQIEQDGKPVAQIFGTMHSNDPEILALPQPVVRAFRAAPSLSLEVILDEGAMQRIGTAMRLPRGQRLQDFVPPDVFGKAAAAAEPLGIQPIQLSRLKPWAVALIISMAPAEEVKPKGAARLPLDLWLMETARKKRKPVYALETLAEQVNVFDALPTDDQVAHLRAVGDSARREAPAVRDSQGRLSARRPRCDLPPRHPGGPVGDPALREKVEKRMLDDRNRRMVERMLPRFDEGGAFIAVGAAHLPGEVGVLHLLERRGYTVSRLH